MEFVRACDFDSELAAVSVVAVVVVVLVAVAVTLANVAAVCGCS